MEDARTVTLAKDTDKNIKPKAKNGSLHSFVLFFCGLRHIWKAFFIAIAVKISVILLFVLIIKFGEFFKYLLVLSKYLSVLSIAFFAIFIVWDNKDDDREDENREDKLSLYLKTAFIVLMALIAFISDEEYAIAPLFVLFLMCLMWVIEGDDHENIDGNGSGHFGGDAGGGFSGGGDGGGCSGGGGDGGGGGACG